MKEAHLLAVDFESTGTVSGYPDVPWQIGMVPIREGRIMYQQASEMLIHVSADRPFNPCAPGSWRTVRDELDVAPSLPDLLPVLRDRMIGYPLVAHNAATEKKFLRKAWPLQRPGPWVDTLKLSRLAFPGLKSYELESVIQNVGLKNEVEKNIPGRSAHDALYDAVACAILFCFIMEQPGWKTIAISELSMAATRPRKGPR